VNRMEGDIVHSIDILLKGQCHESVVKMSPWSKKLMPELMFARNLFSFKNRPF
jgi:hypothetical protein